MNSLSWFLYLVDVLSNLSFAAILILMLGGIVLGFGTLFCALENEEFWWKGWRYSPWLGLLIFITVICPSKDTMYAIAASQVGEQIVKSEAVQGMANGAQKALQQWIKKQIDPPTPEKK